GACRSCRMHPRMLRDKRGCRAVLAADGRGMPEQSPSKPPAHRTRGFLIFVLALFALNWVSLLLTPSGGQPRVSMPFKPFFLQQLQAGEVSSISTKGNSVQGTFRMKLRYPPASKATPTTLFSTEIPAFWNDSQLSALLAEKQVE